MARFLLLLLLVSIAVFMLLELIPGDPVDALVPEGATPEMREQVRELYGLNDPLLQRYASWLGGVLQGDFGRSFQTRLPVAEAIAERAPVSLELAVLAMVVALAISVPVGVWSAYRPGGWVDRVATLVTSATLATPSFVLGILLVYVFGVQLKVLPILGWVPFSQDPVQHFSHLVLPVLTLAAGECVLFTRLLRGDMLATLQQDHVLSARARGLPTWRILARHALRQSSFSLVTVSGVVIGRLIGGTVIVESIFSLPGMGSLVVNAIISRDFIVVQSVVLLTALIYLLMNTLVDLTYPLLDPRVRKATS
ncbi:peptide/nickel transport system permease protein [Kribbella sp. VKM Ac-2527]|uniref:Peptide/nickel transport system permease protein n=1 Tax=Kribbella caucasensis TaxID=2512215 RepID=A0A4R6KAQ8_9ACTN|nr:ABC transporter permease [Kribbella sp. VKM Ac-2527]TDO46396.1 peptide/nickel transport system permease protein [Kribbella sp. VKM Ac-2527]